jgi:hypothetical protein
MDIIINEAREPSDDFWKLSGVLGPTKWTKDPFIVLQEKSEALLIKEQLAGFDQQIKLEQMYTEPMWKDSSYPSDRERYETAVEELETLNRRRAALAKQSGGRKKTLQIHIVEKLTDVLQYPDECVVLKQWPGNWRSDFFKLTVGMLREKASSKPRD